jgi:hypothetical protein
MAMHENDLDRVSRQGTEAWKRLKKEKNWNDWIKVGDALLVGRDLAMHQAETNQPQGSAYNIAFGRWLKQYRLDDMDKGDRARLFNVMAELPQIEEWRRTLALGERLKLNHPNAVLRKFKAAHAPPKPPREKKSKDASAAALDEAAASITAATDRLQSLTNGDRRFDLSPEMIEESARNFAELYGAEPAQRFADALRPAGRGGGAPARTDFPSTAEGLRAGVAALLPLTDKSLGWPETKKADAVRKNLFKALGAAWELLKAPTPGEKAGHKPEPIEVE